MLRNFYYTFGVSQTCSIPTRLISLLKIQVYCRRLLQMLLVELYNSVVDTIHALALIVDVLII